MTSETVSKTVTRRVKISKASSAALALFFMDEVLAAKAKQTEPRIFASSHVTFLRMPLVQPGRSRRFSGAVATVWGSCRLGMLHWLGSGSP